MFIAETVTAARSVIRDARRDGLRVGLVPTMGALHAGHVSLITEARRRCDQVVVSIFVNRSQFSPGEDFDAYPRDIDTDLDVCRSAGSDWVFVPSVEQMDQAQPLKTVSVTGLTDHLCGAHRPGHFDGVTTIVAKLLNIIPADLAFFGEKDYQQLVVVRRMVADLHIETTIVACPTVRDTDGLALSSRNAYLGPAERQRAVSLSAALFEARDRIRAGEHDSIPIVSGIRRRIESALGGPLTSSRIDYVEIVDPVTLESVGSISGPVRICLAVRIGDCRLIDNVAADPDDHP